MLTPEIEAEARRVAAAFGVEEWFVEKRWGGHLYCRSCFVHLVQIRWTFSHLAESFTQIQIKSHEDRLPNGFVQVRRSLGGEWHLNKRYAHYELMARGLYRLGFDDESVLAQLPKLSGHEKLEARLSLPKEFWPKRWLEE